MTTAALYTFTVFHPGYRNQVTIDAFAQTPDDALRSIRRFVARENRRLKRAGVKMRVRSPSPLYIIKHAAA